MHHLHRAVCVVLAAAALTGCATGTTTRARPRPFPGALEPGVTAKADANPVHAHLAQAVLDTALGLRGTQYRLGGQGPSSGFDCSGLVHYVYGQNQIALPRTVIEQFRVGRSVDRTEVVAGDLIFFSINTATPSHVGIAIDGSSFVHAPGTGRVVRLERFDTPYWRSHFAGVRRVLSSSPS